MWDERFSVASFVHQRYFDLEGCKIFLLPQGLVKKRLWSKKYPICLVIARGRVTEDRRQSLSVAGDEEGGRVSNSGSRRASVESIPRDDSLEDPLGAMAREEPVPPEPPSPDMVDMGYEAVGDTPNTDEVRLYLFGRTGREKEEWYRRILAASKGSPFPTRTSDLLRDLSRDTDGARSRLASLTSAVEGHKGRAVVEKGAEHWRQSSTDSDHSDSGKTETSIHKQSAEQIITSYLQYMAKIMPAQPKAPPKSKSPSPSGSKDFTPVTTRKEPKSVFEKPIPVICEPQALWTNALIGRLFWDMLREKYWNDKIREKIQKKLSKIHVSE